MKRQSKLQHFLLGTLVLVAGSATSATAGTSDAWVTTRLKIALVTGSGFSSAGDINIDTVRGHVTLHGKVETEARKARAEEIARKMEHVKSVRNLIQVVPDRLENAVKADDKVIKAQGMSARLEALELGVLAGTIDAPRGMVDYAQCIEGAAFLRE